tara:strand:+ start:406 stop:771 length:366 start_codon:yes stop_codon:yes gene_type:complete
VEVKSIIGVVSVFIACINVWILYAKTKADKEFSTYKNTTDAKTASLTKELAIVVNKQTEHDTKFVTDQRVRDIVKDEIAPLKEEITNMNANVSTMMTSLTELTMEIKVTNAIREHEKARIL